jgi:hypothetical protein
MAENNTPQQQPNNPQRQAPDQQQQQGDKRRDGELDEAGRNPGGEANQGDRDEQTDIERDG